MAATVCCLLSEIKVKTGNCGSCAADLHCKDGVKIPTFPFLILRTSMVGLMHEVESF